MKQKRGKGRSGFRSGMYSPAGAVRNKRSRRPHPRRLTTSPALTRWTRLVEASEDDPDMGFMARLMTLCSLPRTNPGNRLQYIRRNGAIPAGDDRWHQ